MQKNSLSQKKQTDLFHIVHEEITQARIKIAHLAAKIPEYNAIDNILYDLSINAPQKALDTFASKKSL